MDLNFSSYGAFDEVVQALESSDLPAGVRALIGELLGRHNGESSPNVTVSGTHGEDGKANLTISVA